MQEFNITGLTSAEVKARMDEIVEELKHLSVERKQLKEVCDLRVAKMQYDHKEKDNKLLNTQKYLEEELKTLFNRVDHKETKTQRKLTLVSGDVIIKKPKEVIKHDDKQLKEWAETYDRGEFIKTKTTQEFDWSTFKNSLQVEDGKFIDTNTGEVLNIEGLSLEIEDEKVEIK